MGTAGETAMNKKIVIVDYGMGNLQSVKNAFESLGKSLHISQNPQEIADAAALILPGVGAFPQAMKNLKERNLISVLNEEVMVKKKPLLGICLGMQLVATSSNEAGGAEGFNWIPGKVVELEPAPDVKVPHVGWNDLNILLPNTLFKNIENTSNFYFDHSFHFLCDKKYVAATCGYGKVPLVAAVQKDNIFAAQFHPEKSQTSGLRFLRNFLNLVKSC